jgi:LRR receptor-like serine/threonine-protein kinase FLS2
MSSLTYLDLSASGIFGQLPDALAALQQLQMLRAADTQLGGQLPAAFGIMGSLTELDFSNAKIVGTIPGAWADATMLRRIAIPQLEISQRQLQQDATQVSSAMHSASAADVVVATDAEADEQEALMAAKRNMQQALNKLTSGVESVQASGSGDLGILQLQVLRLQGNRLSGTIPGGFAQLVQLQEVNLERNQLVGTLPVQWAALRQLQVGGFVVLSCY